MIKTATPEAYKLLHDGTLAMSQVEKNGIRIDVPFLDKQIQEVGDKIKEIEQELRQDKIYTRTWKGKFKDKTNLGSLPQLAEVIFGELGVSCKNKTATGRFKADEAAFEEVDIPFVKKYMKLGKWRKLHGTFLAGIKREVVDGFLHPSFNLHRVVTYRSSSSEPNFQNFPTRNPELARIIRSCFIPRKGRVLVEIDYSGIEVRIAACYHKDPTMLRYIEDKTTDMHRDMAAQCYLLKTEEVSKNPRYAAKNMFVFPEFYGSVYFQCARHLWEALDRLKLKVKLPSDQKDPTGDWVKDHLAKKGITSLGECNPKNKPVRGTFEYHIQQVEKDFWGNRFSVYASWKDKWYDSYRKHGGFTTYTGFRINGLFSRNDVINYPVQGAAFHCLLWSLIKLQKILNKKGMKTKIVGQIHDSIIADVPENELQEFLHLAKEVMTQRCPSHWPWIITPLEVEVEVAPENWFSKKQWIEKDGNWVTT